MKTIIWGRFLFFFSNHRTSKSKTKKLTSWIQSVCVSEGKVNIHSQLPHRNTIKMSSMFFFVFVLCPRIDSCCNKIKSKCKAPKQHNTTRKLSLKPADILSRNFLIKHMDSSDFCYEWICQGSRHVFFEARIHTKLFFGELEPYFLGG